MKAIVHPREVEGISKPSSQLDLPVLQSNWRSHQIEKYRWPETIILNAPAAGVALFFGEQRINQTIPVYLVNATGRRLSGVFASDAGFIDFDEAHEDTLPHVRALGIVEDGTGTFLDAYNLKLAGDFFISYTVIATTEQGTRHSGTAHISPPPGNWTLIGDWASIEP
ncbi:hypothetical protein N181_01880 [Sinorhizobium fredii USDA 205]|uniref:Uncharacterized protein n=1 Tax=Rhizobium fredii TaxID=380 RepID=A0A844AFN7_RHIFR|nr:hypothetical protein [Sinorhizobium fredii]KSV87374.1 hypothetical protein N181_01880 [Sinorhizobium fredii USDA 205]MQX11783.1 hypothetical protein [Sinorhizobium fredii]GEC31682.1 hypothetical protein EFR01_18530 [Sinorhizobium fredii]GLS09005.1 hypothetical protein GCM10007864_26350 [Sinorhizobium fredii]